MKKVLLAHTHSGAPGGAPCALSEASRCAVALLVRQRLDPAGWGAAALPGGAWQARLWAAGGLTPKLLGRRRESVLGPFAKTATRKAAGRRGSRATVTSAEAAAAAGAHPKAKQRAAIARFERRTAPGARQCPSCLTHDTPMWRKGEWPYGSGVRILFCNSCGLRCKKQTLEPNQVANLMAGAAATSGGGAAAAAAPCGGAQSAAQQASCSSQGGLSGSARRESGSDSSGALAARPPTPPALAPLAVSAEPAQSAASSLPKQRSRSTSVEAVSDLLASAAAATMAHACGPSGRRRQRADSLDAPSGASAGGGDATGQAPPPAAKRRRSDSVHSAACTLDMVAPSTPSRSARTSLAGRPRRSCKSVYG